MFSTDNHINHSNRIDVLEQKQNKPCPDCFAIFTNEYDLLNHRISKCKPNHAISIVRVCSSKDLFATPDSIVEAKVDEDDTNNRLARKTIRRCDGCGYTTKTTYNLNRHKKTCKLLPEDERIKANEVNQTRIPNKNKKYQCERCGVIFIRPDSIKRHQQLGCRANRTIPNFKYFKCIACHKRLVSKQKLETHELSFCPARNSSRLLTCTGCGTNFTKNFNLTRHQLNNCPALKVLTNGSVCYVCSERFQTFDLLKEHLEKNH